MELEHKKLLLTRLLKLEKLVNNNSFIERFKKKYGFTKLYKDEILIAISEARRVIDAGDYRLKYLLQANETRATTCCGVIEIGSFIHEKSDFLIATFADDLEDNRYKKVSYCVTAIHVLWLLVLGYKMFGKPCLNPNSGNTIRSMYKDPK